MSNLLTEFYVTGGTLRRDANCYVVRRADSELLAAIRQGKFCYVLTSRQMGKSSLMVRSAMQLREEGWGVAILDLTAIGQNLTAEQWYRGLLEQLAVQLELEEELIGFWRANKELSPVQRWVRAIREIILPRYLQHGAPVVIFIDEIDAVLSLPFSADEFLAAIRAFYNRRTEDEELERLTFCLLGVASPSDLIRDPRTTPFNIGERIELHDFTEAEALSLARGLNDNEHSQKLLKRIHYWTGGHPYLTQRLCRALAEAGHRIAENQTVDHLCEELFFSPRAQERDDNLLFVRERVLYTDMDLPGVLHLYEQVYRGKRVRDDEANSLTNVLRLSGIVRVENGCLKARNRIYARVFDREWIKTNLPDAELRRQHAAFRRGVVRATAVASLIVAIMAALVFVAWRERSLAREEAKRADRSAAELGIALTEARDQRQVAEQQKTEADAQRQIADDQKDIAEQKQAEAEEQRNLALKQEEDNRWLLYASQMNLAQQAVKENNFGRVRQLLLNYVPSSGQTDMRGFEWYHLWQFCCGTNFASQFTAVPGAISLAYSPDGQQLAMSRRNHEVKVFDARSGREVKTFDGYSGLVTRVAYSPDGQWLATGDFEGTIKLWSTTTGQGRALQQKRFQGILDLVFSPDGKQIATGNSDGTIRIWDFATGRELGTINGHTERVKSVSFSPDGSKLASGSNDKTVRVWSLSNGQSLFTLPYPREVNAVAFSPDGKFLAVGGWGGSASIWELATHQERVLNAHSANLLSLAFSPDGKFLATGSEDRTAKLWSVVTGKTQATFTNFTGNVTSVIFSPDGRNLTTACIDGAVRLWDTVTYQELKSGTDVLPEVWTTAFSPNGKLLATGGVKNKIKLWEFETGKKILELNGGGSTVAFSPEGNRLAFVDQRRTIKIWDLADRKEIASLAGIGQIQSLAFSPNGKTLAAGSGDHSIHLFDAVTWKQFTTLQGHTGYVYSVAYSPDGKTLASASQDRTIILWQAMTGKLLKTLRNHSWTVNSVSFSPDGKLLASGSSDRTARLWDVATGQELKKLTGHANAIMAVRFSPDGKRLATAGKDNLIKIWDVSRGLELVTLSGHQKEVWSLAFSADGRWLASGSYDETVRLWRAATEKEVSAQINPTGKLARRE